MEALRSTPTPGLLAYDATNLLLQAIKDAGEDNTDKVREALNKIKFNAVSGTIVFDKFHNPTKSATILAIKRFGLEGCADIELFHNRFFERAWLEPCRPEPGRIRALAPEEISFCSQTGYEAGWLC